jgi:uncharacterized damage-inducible protein DinB
MHPTSQSFLEASLYRFVESHERIIKCLNVLSDEQILYRPNSVSNNVANIIIHLMGNITQYILSSLGGASDERDRNSEFVPRVHFDRALLVSEVDQVFNKAKEIIQSMTEEELLRKRSVQGFYFDGIGIILHVVEHASYHIGQITYLTKMYTNKETNYYGGIDLNVKND